MTRAFPLWVASCLLLLEAATAYTSLLNQPKRTWTLSANVHSTSSQLLMKPQGDSSSKQGGDLISSTSPHKFGNGRGTFLGFRQVHDFKTQAAEKGSVTTTALNSEMSALIPDGGLSPCVIRVLGVGGGGCNDVSESGKRREKNYFSSQCLHL